MTECDTILKRRKTPERDLEDFVIDNINEISINCKWGEIERVQRQYIIPLGDKRIFCDIMLWHKDGSGTCIEIKTGENNRNDDLMGIGQLLFYGYCIEKKLSKMPRLVLVSPFIKDESWDVVKRFNLPFAFLEVTDDKCIYLSNGGK